jgi:hypothetical protein
MEGVSEHLQCLINFKHFMANQRIPQAGSQAQMVTGFSISSYISGLVKIYNYNNSNNNYTTIPFECGFHPKSSACFSRQGNPPPKKNNNKTKNYTQNKADKN